MARNNDCLDNRICRVLAEAYPDCVTVGRMAQEVGSTEVRIETRIQRRLSQRKLCERITDEGVVMCRASERLYRQYHEDTDSKMVHGEEHEAMECHEDFGTRLASEREAVTSHSVMGSPRHVNKPSILPLRVRPKSRAPSAIGPSYTTAMHVWQPNVAPQPIYPPQMHPTVVLPAGHMQQPMWYAQPQMRVETPASFSTAIHPSQPLKKSVLPVKLVRRDQAARREDQHAESKKSAIFLDNGRFDGSLFPDGLWNHVLYETCMARMRTEDMEKLMARRFIPVTKEGLHSVDGLSKSVGVKPQGRGDHATTPASVKSLRSMGPVPPGFTRTPPNGLNIEERADHRRRPMSQLIAQERRSLENASAPNTGSPSSSQ